VAFHLAYTVGLNLFGLRFFGVELFHLRDFVLGVIPIGLDKRESYLMEAILFWCGIPPVDDGGREFYRNLLFVSCFTTDHRSLDVVAHEALDMRSEVVIHSLSHLMCDAALD
jgi:hypothetical protein